MPLNKMIPAAALAALALLAPCAASATIGEADLGKNALTSGNGTTLQITTSNDCPTGALAWVVTAVNATGTGAAATAVADSNASSYTKKATYAPASGRITGWVKANTPDLASGQSITSTFGGTANSHLAAALCATGVANGGQVDAEGAGATATGSGAQTMATIVVANAPELLVVYDYIVAANGDTFTEDAGNGWTTANTAAVAGTNLLRMAWQLAATNGTYTYAPTLGTSRTWLANYAVINAAPAPSAPGCRGRLMTNGMGC